MDNILESMFLLELERLETKNCLACSSAALTENGTTPQELSIDHTCYNHNKTYSYFQCEIYGSNK